MLQFVIDELNPPKREKAAAYLQEKCLAGPIADIYWLQVPQDILSTEQESHTSCAPFYFSMELLDTSIHFELLIRSSSNLHCSCISYTTPEQRNFILQFIDTMTESLALG